MLTTASARLERGIAVLDQAIAALSYREPEPPTIELVDATSYSEDDIDPSLRA